MPRVEVGIETLAVERGVRERRLVQLEQRIVRAPWPDPGVVAAGAAVRVSRNVVFHHHTVGGPWDNAVATHVFDEVVADRHVEAGEPLGAAPVVADSRNPRSIHLPDDVSLDCKSVETARLPVAFRAKNDPAVVFGIIAIAVGPVHVMNVQTGHDDVPGRPEIIQEDVNAATHRRLLALVGDFEIAHLDVLDVIEADGVLHFARGVDPGQRAAAVAIDDDRRALASRSRGR